MIPLGAVLPSHTCTCSLRSCMTRNTVHPIRNTLSYWWTRQLRALLALCARIPCICPPAVPATGAFGRGYIPFSPTVECGSILLFFPGATRDRHERCGLTFHCTENPDLAGTLTLVLEAGPPERSPTAEPLVECLDRISHFMLRKLFLCISHRPPCTARFSVRRSVRTSLIPHRILPLPFPCLVFLNFPIIYQLFV